ncbi:MULTISPECIES: DUF1427 family protein [Rhizobium/Agrobacterium group]|uniref:DUF1427 family protein n=1 Tax=Rhizobium/Agrobacterium group TaxID=227290 RepID=UPI001571EFF2|nr:MULTISPECIES: DUF1427 family protein [Rhizobium/Agrobacterium group]NTC82505.1 XapX domain-containing protein [Agrobacterium tumefaciens]NTD11328.1 XapX domain-containing protein [Agrobacterium tumefaciens]NTD86806.1 XapX domain-containing protein [Agrobacterium tumefaciens]NTD93031.1 XapX domain-containing protein [Agrobacterium tumefaciens]NTE00722.1 XapX domain-containing protein [Agrobacterium tumefaciens]
MKAHILSLSVGALVGVLYGIIGVRSPAPPIIALLGLLGMVAGEQIVEAGKTMLTQGKPVPSSSATPDAKD